MTDTSAIKPLPCQRTLLVTGMSGAGKSTALHCLEDMGWETVDNLPLSLFERLLESPRATDDEHPPLAIGIDTRTRDFDAEGIVARIDELRSRRGISAEALFLDCGDAEIERRFSETRRRHPLALDRPVSDGIAMEREMLAPLLHRADHLIDTSDSGPHLLQQELRRRFANEASNSATIIVMSFSYARGLPRNADLVFDMRFLRNPHWDDVLRPRTGMEADVGAHIAADDAYAEAIERIEGLLLLLLPRYQAEGKSYVTVAFGCTGGRHRSVHVAEKIAARLRAEGFSPTVAHRDLATPPRDAVEGIPAEGNKGAGG